MHALKTEHHAFQREMNMNVFLQVDKSNNFIKSSAACDLGTLRRFPLFWDRLKNGVFLLFGLKRAVLFT